MKYEKAIEILKHEHDYAQLLSYVNEALKMAISALEMRIKEPPYLETPIGAYDWFFCPNCNHNDVEYKDKYCRRCGQALDWRK